MFKILLSLASNKQASGMPSGKPAFCFRLPSGNRSFLKILVKLYGKPWSKQQGKRSCRLPGLKSMIYLKCAFRIPSVLLPDRQGHSWETCWSKWQGKLVNRKNLPGCLPETPWFASGYLPGCGVFEALQMLNFLTIRKLQQHPSKILSRGFERTSYIYIYIYYIYYIYIYTQ